MRTALLALTLAATACVGTGAPRALRGWVESTYTPAMAAVHDPRLAPYRLSPKPTAAELRRDCAEALRRHDEWDGRLRDAPHPDVRDAVERYLKAERAQLDGCVRTGEFVPDDHVAPVMEALRDNGVPLVEG